MQPNHDLSYAFRLKPGEDLCKGIQQFVKDHDIRAGWIQACVGSLATYNIRFANKSTPSTDTGHFEIVGLSGTLSNKGSHLHISIADGTGKMIGGHLLTGCIIYTTAEIIITASARYIFSRAMDGSTPWKELQITENTNTF